MRVRKQQTFYGTTKKETEAEAMIFAESVDGMIFFTAPVASLPIGENDWKRPHKWQVDVEYYEEAADVEPHC
jgi:hypothetical protein